MPPIFPLAPYRAVATFSRAKRLFVIDVIKSNVARGVVVTTKV
jgi:hypothetical protein